MTKSLLVVVVALKLRGASALAPSVARPVKVVDERRIGSLRVPTLAIGTISWKPDRGYLPGDRIVGTTSEEAQRRLAQRGLDVGLTFFDTAERYSVGAGESLLASALEREGEPRRAVVASKFTPAPWRVGAEAVVAACEASRKRLGVEKIDLYQLHMPDIVQPLRVVGYVDAKDEAYWDGLVKCKELGLVEEVGVSNYGPTLLRRCHAYLKARGVRLASNQIHYSLLARKDGNQAAVDAANDLGVATLAYYPLARGLLTSSKAKKADEKNSPKKKKKSKSSLSHYERGGVGIVGLPWLEKNRIRIPKDGVGPLVRALELVAKKYGNNKTASQVALNWIISQGVIPIVGATSETYLLDARGALGWRLSKQDQRFLEQSADDLGFEFRGTFFKRVDGKFVGYGVETWALD